MDLMMHKKKNCQSTYIYVIMQNNPWLNHWRNHWFLKHNIVRVCSNNRTTNVLYPKYKEFFIFHHFLSLCLTFWKSSNITLFRFGNLKGTALTSACYNGDFFQNFIVSTHFGLFLISLRLSEMFLVVLGKITQWNKCILYKPGITASIVWSWPIKMRYSAALWYKDNTGHYMS